MPRKRLSLVSRPLLSVVLPCFNEHENLETLRERLVAVLDRVAGEDCEVIFVDDGSSDGTSEILDGFAAADPRFRVLHLSRNFGHQAALSAGLDASNGKAVVLMDCDLQDPPEVIEDFVDRWKQGYDVAYAVRRRRKESIAKRAAYRVFYRSMRLLANIDIPLDAGDFCLLDRRVVDTVVALPERQRFLRGLRAWVGFRQVAVPYERAARFAGEPKYNLRRLAQLAVSGYVGFSATPLRAATWLGFTAAGCGLLTMLWVLAAKIADPLAPRGWASISALVLFIGGVQLLVLGVIGEYLGRVYDEVRRRPSYIVGNAVGFAQMRAQSPADPDDAADGAAPVISGRVRA